MVLGGEVLSYGRRHFDHLSWSNMVRRMPGARGCITVLYPNGVVKIVATVPNIPRWKAGFAVVNTAVVQNRPRVFRGTSLIRNSVPL